MVLGIRDAGVLKVSEDIVHGGVHGIVIIFGVVFIVGGRAIYHGLWGRR